VESAAEPPGSVLGGKLNKGDAYERTTATSYWPRAGCTSRKGLGRLTEPEQIMKWWGPKDFTSPAAKVDLRVGGKYLFCMHGQPGPDAPAMDMWSGGTYDEVVPLQKLVCLDSFSNENGDVVPASAYGLTDFPDVMRITLEFEALPDGNTKLTVTHEGTPAGAQFDDMEQGWNQSLDKLAGSL